jgi:Orotidine 5'-phosphate decarboxylase / HUMPS family
VTSDWDVFLDVKLHDIPNTVGSAARVLGSLGASFLTVHAAGGEAMLRAAVEDLAEGADRAGLPVPVALAVTVLTSQTDAPPAKPGEGRASADPGVTSPIDSVIPSGADLCSSRRDENLSTTATWICGTLVLMNVEAGRALLEYTRWLTDRHAVRLAGIESRAGVVLGWASTQVAVTVAVMALLPNVRPGWLRTFGAVVLAIGGCWAVSAVVLAVWGVIRARTVVAPEADLTDLIEWARERGDDIEMSDLIDRLVGALNDEGEGGSGERRSAVVTALATEVDRRGRCLRWAATCLMLAAISDATAAILLAVTAMQ